MLDGSPFDKDVVRAAEIIGSLSLATDLAMRLPLEHGMRSTMCAMRLAERLSVDTGTALQTFYGCLLFYVGCTADAEVNAELFDEGALLSHFTPVMFGSRAQTTAGIMRALTSAESGATKQAVQVATRLPKAVRGHKSHLAALCEVAQMLTDRLGLPSSVRGLFSSLTERWDGKGEPTGLRGDEIPLALRIIHVARDAAFQQLVGGKDYASELLRERAGHAFDPEIANLAAQEAGEILAVDPGGSAWGETLAHEPRPSLELRGEQIDSALSAMGDFADLLSPYLAGHSAGVALLAARAAEACGWPSQDVAFLRRAAWVHDVGRVAVPAGIWNRAGPLTADEWERVRLHAYHGERILFRSHLLARLAAVAGCHHERVDGSGYHRGASGPALGPAARLLAAADVYHAMTEARPYRAAIPPARAAELLGEQVRGGRLDGDGVSAVLDAAGHPRPRFTHPAGLTDREVEVVALLSRGLQTKQIARALGISIKTADRHVQNAYAKIGISTRAAATLFAMQHGLTSWGELPIVPSGRRT